MTNSSVKEAFRRLTPGKQATVKTVSPLTEAAVS